MSFKNHHIWLVGASSGIGRALTIALAKLGNNLVISARNKIALDEIANQFPTRIKVLAFDVTDASHQKEMREKLSHMLPNIDTVILNAGTASYLSSKDVYLKTTKEIFDVNFFGSLNCIDIVMPLLKNTSGKKLIAGVSSLSTYVPLPRAEAYGSSKAALTYFLESLRIDLFKENIDISIINPGFVKTPLTDKNDFDMPWLWSVERAAQHICTKLSGHPSEIRFPHQLVIALNILASLPRNIYTRLAQKMVKDS